jgi:hypothetical protein
MEIVFQHALAVRPAAGLLGLMATAMLLGACQQPSSSGPSRVPAVQQNADAEMAIRRERHCCHRAARGSNH